MSEHNFCVNHNDTDYEVVCDCYFGADTKHGDFEILITEVYLDIDAATNMEGKNLVDDFEGNELDEMTDKICEMEDLTGLAFEEACDKADWMRDQRKDEGL